jgi:glutathione S-transferase
VMIYRYTNLIPERPKLANLDRWYGALAERKAFRDHVSSIPLT